MTPPLTVQGLRVTFPGPHGPVPVLDGIDLSVGEGEVLGIVGESGSGKSMTLRAIMRIVRPPGRMEGRVLWHGTDLLAAPEARLRDLRGREIAIIFQEPMSALNPVMTVGRQITESLAAHTALGARARPGRAAELLNLVGIPDARRRLHSYPHEFSGGMRQRVMIAIALAAEPKLLLADEPTTALDVTIQDQILKLLLRLRAQIGMSIILVTHDLGVVAQSCDRVAVMYAGRICETGRVADVLAAPLHAYTVGLLRSLPEPAQALQRLMPIPGAPPVAGTLAEQCAFAPRCVFALPACTSSRPSLRPAAGDRATSCLAADQLPQPRSAVEVA